MPVPDASLEAVLIGVAVNLDLREDVFSGVADVLPKWESQTASKVWFLPEHILHSSKSARVDRGRQVVPAQTLVKRRQHNLNKQNGKKMANCNLSHNWSNHIPGQTTYLA